MRKNRLNRSEVILLVRERGRFSRDLMFAEQAHTHRSRKPIGIRHQQRPCSPKDHDRTAAVRWKLCRKALDDAPHYSIFEFDGPGRMVWRLDRDLLARLGLARNRPF